MKKGEFFHKPGEIIRYPIFADLGDGLEELGSGGMTSQKSILL